MLKITDAAHNHLLNPIISGFFVLYVRIKKSGCSGFSTLFEVYESLDDLQNEYPAMTFDTISTEHYSIVWDASLTESLSGGSLDYRKIDLFTTQLVLDLPSKTTVCGCGESFSFGG